MKEGWEYRKLGDICDFEGGAQPPKSEWTKEPIDGYVRMLQIRDFTKSRDFDIEYVKLSKKLRLCKADDILIGRYGASVGKILTGLEGAYNVAIIKSIPNEEYIYRSYIRRFFESPLFQKHLLKVCNSRTAQAGFSKEDISDLVVPVPPLSEQERIVALLDDQFAKIDALKANAASQLQAAKDLFQLLFKQMIVNIGECGFDTLGDICTTINGLWKGKKPPFVNVGVIRNANFTKEFTLNFSNIEYLDVEERQYRTRKLEKGDLIVEKSGGSEKQPVGRTVLFDSEGDFSISNFTSILRIKDKGLYLPKFVYLYMLYMYKEGVTKEMQNATTGIHNIIFDKFLAIKIPTLSIAQQENIINKSEKLMDKIRVLQSNYEQTITLCNDLKQSLLKSIFE